MKLFCLVICLQLSLSTTLFGQLDTLIYTSGDTVAVNLQLVGEATIQFTYPDEAVRNEVSIEKLDRVIHRSGRIQIFKKNLLTESSKVNSVLDWEKVRIVDFESDVKGLLQLGNVTAGRFGGSLSSVVKLQSKTLQIVQKKAAMWGGNTVYLRDLETEGGGVYKRAGAVATGIIYTPELPNLNQLIEGTYRVQYIASMGKRSVNYNLSNELYKERDHIINSDDFKEKDGFYFLKKKGLIKDFIVIHQLISIHEEGITLSAKAPYGEREYNVILKRISDK